MNVCFRLARRTFPRAPPNTLRHSYRSFASSRTLRFSHIPIQRLPRRHQWSRRLYCFGLGGAGGTITLALAAPIAVAPNESNESEESDDKITAEQRLLQQSDQERREAHTVSEDLPIVLKLWQKSCRVVVDWIIEPVATGFRFITLLCIFTPVILAIPIVYIGPRVSDKSGERKGTIWWYQFLVKSLERAGPTFIKLGQWAASRTDIFPIELCDIMGKLHSNAKQHSFRATKRIIAKAFNCRDFNDIFEEFDEVPLGVGAIAQVYKAKLKPDFVLPDQNGERKNTRMRMGMKVGEFIKSSPPEAAPSSHVAIKVIHPRVEKIVHRDLRIMRFFAVILNSIPTLEWFSFPDEVTTFSEMMRLQLDLRIEAENLVMFRKNFKKRTTVSFPRPYRDFCTRDVLIEEFAHGIPLSRFLENGAGVYQEEVANMGLDAFLHMLVMDNFIHSDLHPGNIMVRFCKPPPPHLPFWGKEADPKTVDFAQATAEVRQRLEPHQKDPVAWTKELDQVEAEGYRPQLVFIDTGLVTELNALNRRNFLDLFRAVAEFDGYRAGHLMIERSRSPSSVLEGEIFALKMQHLVLAVKSRTLALGNMSFGDILAEVLQMVRTHHVRMEGDFVNVVLSMLLLEGIGRSLDPQMDLLKSSLPMLRAVGAASAYGSMRDKGEESGLSNTLSFMKVWLVLEGRQFVNSTVEDVERLVKYDLLSPNV